MRWEASIKQQERGAWRISQPPPNPGWPLLPRPPHPSCSLSSQTSGATSSGYLLSQLCPSPGLLLSRAASALASSGHSLRAAWPLRVPDFGPRPRFSLRPNSEASPFQLPLPRMHTRTCIHGSGSLSASPAPLGLCIPKAWAPGPWSIQSPPWEPIPCCPHSVLPDQRLECPTSGGAVYLSLGTCPHRCAT